MAEWNRGRNVAKVICLIFLVLTFATPHVLLAFSLTKLNAVLTNNADQNLSTIPAIGSIELGFSPNDGAESLVLKVIDSAQVDVKVLAYSFTNPKVVSALLRAVKRGAAVSILVDYKHNVLMDHSRKARSALSALAESGCNVRVISVYPIHHDKVIIVDQQTVQIGSFNYSDAAARLNSENVFVNWNNPVLAKAYTVHFERNWKQSKVFQLTY